jgi:hypothetical protein
MRVVTGYAPIIKGLVPLGAVERGPVMADKALFVAGIFLKKTVIRGMGFMAGYTLALLQNGVHIISTFHFCCHLGVAQGTPHNPVRSWVHGRTSSQALSGYPYGTQGRAWV